MLKNLLNRLPNIKLIMTWYRYISHSLFCFTDWIVSQISTKFRSWKIIVISKLRFGKGLTWTTLMSISLTYVVNTRIAKWGEILSREAFICHLLFKKHVGIQDRKHVYIYLSTFWKCNCIKINFWPHCGSRFVVH